MLILYSLQVGVAFIDKMLNMDEEKKYKIVTVGEGKGREQIFDIETEADRVVAFRGITELQSCSTHRLHGAWAFAFY